MSASVIVTNESAQSWNQSPKKMKPIKGLRERLSREKKPLTEAEIVQRQSDAEARRFEVLSNVVDKASVEQQKYEKVIMRTLDAEAAAQASIQAKQRKSDQVCAAYQDQFERRVNGVRHWREVVRHNATTEQAKADREKAEMEASIIPVHELSR